MNRTNDTAKKGMVSIVIPVYNEQGNLEPLFEQLNDLRPTLNRRSEIIFVDDGSTDKSFSVLSRLKERTEDMRIIRLKRNFGQTAALTAGFRHAQGDIVVTMDADLQNDPADIPRLLDEFEKGYDIVSGWRKSRKDPFFSRRLPSVIANAIISWYTGVRLHDYGCTLKAYRRELVKDINLYGELHRFIPALLSWSGATIKEIPVGHRARTSGSSKYGLGRTVNVVLDLLTVKFLLSSSKGPMQIFGRMGLWCLSLGFLSGVTTLAMKIFIREDITGNPFLYLSILLTVVSLQFFSLGLLGEITIRISGKSHEQSIYVIESTTN